MRIFANFRRDGLTAVAESALKAIRKQVTLGDWVVAVYGNGNARIFRFCPEFPPAGTMYCVGPYNRHAEPEHIEEDLLHEMQEATAAYARPRPTPGLSVSI